MLKIITVTKNAVLVNYNKDNNTDVNLIGDLILKDFIINNCIDGLGFAFLAGDVDKILNYINN